MGLTLPARGDDRVATKAAVRPFVDLTAVNWELVAYIAIFILAVVLRFWDLGTRVLHHDESIHAVQSWRIYTGAGYWHDPVYHGQFLYYANALIYFILGASDYTARVAPALAGTVLVFLPRLLRDRLGRSGALIASLLLAVSPSVLYYSRSLRHDIYAAVATVMLAIALWRHVDERKPRWLFLGAGALALGFTNHELTYITVFIFATFLAATVCISTLILARSAGNGNSRVGYDSAASFVKPAGDFLLLLTTICAPLFAAAILIPKPLADLLVASLGTNALLGISFFALAAFSIAVGFRWQGRRWFLLAALFWGIFGLIYTGFFTDPAGFFSGAIGALQYWLTQQSYRRGAQPWYYYLLLLPLYDFLPLIFAVIATVYHLARGRLFGLFLIFWSFASLAMYSWAGEKMPWLVIHISIPLIFLSSSFLGDLVENTDWRGLWQRRGYALPIFGVIALLALLGFLLSSWRLRPLRPGEQNYLSAEWLLLSIVVFGALVGVAQMVNRLGATASAKIVAAALFVILLATTVHISLQANFHNTDTPVEMLIYTQSSPDIRDVMKEIDAAAFRAGTGANFKIAYDSGVSWPFEWYLRDYPGKVFFGMGSPPPDAAVVLVGFEDNHDAAIRAQLGDRYVGQRYKLRWWFPEDYKSAYEWVTALQSPEEQQQTLRTGKTQFGFSDVISQTLSPTGLSKLFRYFLYREPLRPLGSTDFMFYVRKDLASGGSASPTVSQTTTSDEYVGKYHLVNSTQAIGGKGSGEGQLGDPKGVAVAPDGSIYVSDTQSKRIIKYSSAGMPLLQWGGSGSGDGQFNDAWGPWGLAVDRDGNVYVADMWNHRIQKFTADGQFILKWGHQGTGPGEFFGPRGVAVDASGNVYVTDTGNHRVQRFDGQGNFLGQVGGQGSGENQFREPVGIAVDSAGYVYVADTWNQRIQKLDPNLKVVGSWPVKGWAGQAATNKPYLAVDGQANLYATDPDRHRVLKFTTIGTIVAVWGQQGIDMSSLQFPLGIAADQNGSVLVVDDGNQRVLRFPG